MTAPKFSVMEYREDGDYWSCNATRDTYKKALNEKRRLEGNGCENLYVVGLSFIVGPKAKGLDEY